MNQKPTVVDTNWLLGSMAAVIVLHISHLALWISFFVLIIGSWRFYLAKKELPLPSLWLILPIAVAAVMGISFSYHGFFGRDASVALLCVMLALKWMESGSRRDYILVVFLGYFLTINAFLFTQSLLVGTYMIVPITALTATLVGISHPNGQLSAKFQTQMAGKMLLQGLPLMLALFILFPRVPGPLWGVPRDAYSGMTGLSDNMQPGNISKLSLSGAVAFRAEFKEKVPNSNQLYWRGPVLWHFDGRSWRMSSQNLPIARESLDVTGEPLQYTITLEPHNRNWLFMLDMPRSLPPDSLVTRDMQILSKSPIRTRIRYDGISSLNYTLAAELSDRERDLALQIPDDENPQSIALAKSWVTAKQTPEQIVQTALTMFNQEKFTYTLSPPILGRNPVDDFLFNTRRGFCEHFSSSFVYLMRVAGIPARVVTGYQGGEINPVGNYLIVRQSDAHAWAEVWLKGKGWVRIDPTAAVSPSRVELGLASAIPESTALPLMARKDFPLLRKLYLNWDAVNNGWNQWVLGYDQKRQMELFEKLTGSQMSWQDFTLAMVICITFVSGVISFYLLRGKRQKLDPLVKIYKEFVAKLTKIGIKPYAHEGPVDFSQRASKRLPAKADEITRITQMYTELRYRSRTSKSALAQFKQLIKSFKP